MVGVWLRGGVVRHDKFCVEAGLQVLRPVEDSDPIERVRNEA